jgi:hypothetical protein
MPHFLDSWFPSEDGFEKQSYADHIHPHVYYGHPCKCPWGRDMERLGHVKEAAKIDWLRDRKDMQDEEGKAFLDRLEKLHFAEKADKLLPWVVREWRRGRLYNHPSYGGPNYRADSLAPAWNPVGTAEDNWGAGRGYGHQWLTANHLEEWQKLLDEMKKHRQGIDVMQHSIHELQPKLDNFKRFLEEKRAPYFGEVYHTFDDGWTVRRVRNAEEATREGNQMGHCVGSYGGDIDKGHSHIWSLRDPNNQPHATLEMHNPQFQNRKTGEVIDGHPGHTEDDYEGYSDEAWKPLVHDGISPGQFYGKEDSSPLPEYVDRMNAWLAPHDVYAEGSDGENEGEEQWWPDYYTVPASDNVREYLGEYEGDGNGPEPPDEYHQAYADAENWGFDPPELENEPPKFHDIFRDHATFHPAGQERNYWHRPYNFDEDEAKNLFHVAAQKSELPDLLDAYHHWNTDLYDPNDHQHRALNDWWKNTITQNTNPDTGQFEEPRLQWPHDWDNPQYETAIDRWWQQNQQQHPQLPGTEWQPEGELQPIPEPMRQSLLAKAGSRSTPPLYYRWVFSPDTGEVVIGHNEEDHPALVRYHKELAGQLNRPNLTHGYAYRLVGGWRLTDWEHKPLEDPFITSQILNKLGEKASIHEDNSWVPAQHDYDRSHYGLPTPKDSS